MLEDLVPSSESCLIECVERERERERERMHMYVYVHVCGLCVYLLFLVTLCYNNKEIFPGYENWFLLLYLGSHVSRQWLPKLTAQRIIAKYRCRDCADTDPMGQE